MDEVYVYDIASEVWFLQKTSGDIPLGREESCAAVVSAPDGSSHQVSRSFLTPHPTGGTASNIEICRFTSMAEV